MTEINEAVTVALNQNGQPVEFRWRGGQFSVSEKPVRWFARREWWIEAARVQRGVGAGVLEVEMWRLIAMDKAVKRKTQYELQRSMQDNSWKLIHIYE